MNREDVKKNHVATLNDVARKAGVSTATVSRCINNAHQVGEATREKVMRAVKDLSYSPNFGAKIMAARRTNTIGAVIPTIENSIFAQGIQAFQEVLDEYGYTLLVASSSYKPDLEEQQIRNLIARGAEALLLIGYERDDDIYQFLNDRRLPVVLTWSFDETGRHNSIGFDNCKAMDEMAEHVINLGHRQIGAIIAETTTNDRSRDRLKGIQSAMARHKLPSECLSVEETPYSIESGAQAFQNLYKSEKRPTVVMCGNDVLAAGALNKAKELGLRVPDDISITGFDDIELARVVDPPLTTVHVPHREMGMKAAEMLVQWINTNTPQASHKLETYICKRATLAAPNELFV